MRYRLLCLLLPLAIGAAVPATAAQVYRWMDEQGKIHFSDRAPTEQGVQNLQLKSYEGAANISLVPGSASVQGVTMLSASWCGVCKKAKAYLAEIGVAFLEYDVETSTIGRQEYERLNGKGVPIILVGNQRMNGFSAAKLEHILRDAGLLPR